MPRSHKVQVTLNENEYAAIRRRAEAEGLKHAAVVREAIQEYCVKPDRRQRQLEALEALRRMPPAPFPESWSEWKQEYSRLKTKFRVAEWPRQDPPTDTQDTEAGAEAND